MLLNYSLQKVINYTSSPNENTHRIILDHSTSQWFHCRWSPSLTAYQKSRLWLLGWPTLSVNISVSYSLAFCKNAVRADAYKDLILCYSLFALGSHVLAHLFNKNKSNVHISSPQEIHCFPSPCTQTEVSWLQQKNARLIVLFLSTDCAWNWTFVMQVNT